MNALSHSRSGSLRLNFGHRDETLRFWRILVKRALVSCETPFYLFSIEPVREALAELKTLDDALDRDREVGRASVLASPAIGGRRTSAKLNQASPGASPQQQGTPIRHWLSCKTQPIRPLLQWWREQGLNIEVVSEFEFLAARAEGFPPDRILVNGPAKHHWLPRHAVRGLFVNFDSTAEARALMPLAKKLHWRVGVRCLTREEFDPEDPRYPTQFGLAPNEAITLLKRLMRAGVRLEIIHTHIRTNVASAETYGRALQQMAEICRAAGFRPKYVDCGGGFPPPNVLSDDG